MGPKIQRVRLNNFRASGSILTGLFSVDAPRSRGDKMGTIFTIRRNLAKFWQKISLHSFFETRHSMPKKCILVGPNSHVIPSR